VAPRVSAREASGRRRGSEVLPNHHLRERALKSPRYGLRELRVFSDLAEQGLGGVGLLRHAIC
jgi:hypothetical protein